MPEFDVPAPPDAADASGANARLNANAGARMRWTLDGRYDVVREVGRGGLGVAFVARDRGRGDAEVLVKVLCDLGPAARVLLEAEVRALERLRLPFVPRLHDMGALQTIDGPAPDAVLRAGALFMVRDLVDGDDLFASTRGLAWEATRPLVIALAAALEAIHARGLAHGDLKPQNILVPRAPPPGAPLITLIDFGPGQTVEFLAPERIRGAPPDRRSDLFALGATLYRVLCGDLAFSGRTSNEVARAVIERTPPALEVRAPHLPAHVSAAVMRLLERVPARRFPSAAAFLRALQDPLERTRSEPSEHGTRGDGASAVPIVLSLHAAPLVAREAEVAVLRATIVWGVGRPQVAMVEGATGSGRSRLLREAALEARLSGLAVAEAVGRPGAAPLSLFREALPALLHQATDGSAVGPRGRPEGAPASASSDPGSAVRARDAMAGAILALARERPFALILDDLDRASEEDIALFGLLARRLANEGAPLYLIAALRDEKSAVRALPGVLVRLVDLPPKALPAFVQGALGRVASGEDALLEALLREGGGNPALLAAALGRFARAGALSQSPRGVRFDAEAARANSRARSTPSDDSARESSPVTAPWTGDARVHALARALAVIERPVSIDVAAAAAGLGLADAAEAFARLREDGFAITTQGRLALTDEALCAIAHDTTAPDRSEETRAEPAERERANEAQAASSAADPRAAYARRAAAALEAQGAADPGEVGKLYARAGAHAEAAPHLFEAGRRARQGFALAAARASFEAAARSAAASGDLALRSDALAGAGEAALAAGAAVDAAKLLREALASGRPEHHAASLLLLARASAKAGDLDGALAHLAEVRTLPSADLVSADQLEGALHLARGDAASAELALTRALEGARDPTVRAAALGELAGVRFRRGAAAAAAALLVDAARLYRASADFRGQALTHTRLGHAVEARGDREAAVAHHRRAIRLYRRAGDRAGLATALGNLGSLYRHQDDLVRAGKLFRRSVRLLRELGILPGLGLTLANLGLTLLAAGRPEAALRALRAARRAATLAREDAALLHAETSEVEALAALGRTLEARALVRSVRRRERARPQAYGGARSQWALAHVLLAEGDAKAAAERFRRAERALAKLGHPVDLFRAHVLLAECYRRVAHLPSTAHGMARSPAAGAAGGNGSGGAGEGASNEVAVASERTRGDRLLRSAIALAEEANAQRLLERVCADAVALLGAERAFVVLAREDGGLELAASGNVEGESVVRAESKAPRALLEAVLREGRTIASPDALRDRRLRELTSIQLLDVRSVLAVPIRDAGGATVGALYADHRFKPGGFGDRATITLEGLAAMASVAISRARLRDALAAREGELSLLRASLETTAPVASLPADENSEGPLATPSARDAFAALAGQSRGLREVVAQAARVASSDIPVLILGESGTGKELLARALHFASPRRERPFVAESCAALPEALLESVLFGHVRGAFTGAFSDHEGLCVQANGGTLFLDEVGDTSPALQAKLLRVLQEGEVRPVGGTRTHRVDIRIVAATNRDLDAMRRDGRFREDLFFRLSGWTLRLPPLRDRTDDIVLLAERFLGDAARRAGRRRLGLTVEAAALLRAYRWPGNVRELEHAMRAAALFAERGRIGPEALRAAGIAACVARGGESEQHDEPHQEQHDEPLGGPALRQADASPTSYAALRASLDERERTFVRAALAAAGHNRARAAEALGLSRYALKRLMTRLGLTSTEA